MAIKESALALITSITQSDLVRAVTAAGASRRITVANLAKAIIENYTGSSLAGSSQSVKAALDSLNSNNLFVTPTESIPSGADLNSYTSIGRYTCSGSSVAATLSNSPIINEGFYLDVMGGLSPSVVLQKVYSVTGKNVCMRRIGTSGASPSPWARYSFTLDS